MNRVVKRIPRSDELFPYVYEGFLAGGQRAEQAERTLDVKRLERSILRALRKCSYPLEQKYPGTEEAERRLQTSTGPDEVLFSLSPVEMDLLVKYIGLTPWQIWKTDVAMDAVDWLQSADLE